MPFPLIRIEKMTTTWKYILSHIYNVSVSITAVSNTEKLDQLPNTGDYYQRIIKNWY